MQFRTEQKIRLKLSGDGTNIGKRLHVINFTFTLLDEGSKAYSSDGNHVIAILKDEENFDSLQRGLADVRNEVEQLTSIEVEGITYDLEYYLGGDWKFLAIVMGIDSAKSDYACIWCKCSKEERSNMDKTWSITDTTHGARTIQENIELSRKPKSKKEYNVSHPPLFPTIPLHNVVIDNLHMFLRVSDVLVNLLLVDLKRADAIEKLNKFSKFDSEKYKHLDAYQKFVSGLGVPGYKFRIGQNSKQLKIRSLTGPERLKVFKHIIIQQLLPKEDPSERARKQVLWNELLELHETFSKRPEDVTAADIDSFDLKSKEWVRKFTQVYHSDKVTPYIHAMANHTSQFMRVHGSILAFTQQGLEKFNDTMTKDYFRATCHRNEQALIQILQKRNRMEHMKDMDTVRPKHHDVSCSFSGKEALQKQVGYFNHRVVTLVAVKLERQWLREVCFGIEV